MANHPSALKRHRQSLKRASRNRSYRSQLKTFSKKVEQALSFEEAQGLFQKAMSFIHKAAQRGILHRNTAARKISKLSRTVESKKG